MKKVISYFSLVLAFGLFASSCGEGTGDPVTPRAAPEVLMPSDPTGVSNSPARVGAWDSLAGPKDAGILSVQIGGGRPIMPWGTRGVVITIDEAAVFERERGWISLPLARSPLPVDMLQVADGRTYALVPDSRITPGKYSRVRIGISKAAMSTYRGLLEINVPPYSRKPDMDFPFEVKGGERIRLTVDFDLGRSIMDRGSDFFTLDPVLRIVQTQRAATIQGTIRDSMFGFEMDRRYASKSAQVEVYWDRNKNGRPDGDELHTKINVENRMDPAPFGIYWLPPEENYIVSVRADGKEIYREVVEARNLSPGGVWALNKGKPI